MGLMIYLKNGTLLLKNISCHFTYYLYSPNYKTQNYNFSISARCYIKKVKHHFYC